MAEYLGIITLIAYLLGLNIERWPRLGYLLTWPFRIVLPFQCYYAMGSDIEGVFVGLGFSILLSFELVNHAGLAWLLALACFVLPSLF